MGEGGWVDGWWWGMQGMGWVWGVGWRTTSAAGAHGVVQQAADRQYDRQHDRPASASLHAWLLCVGGRPGHMPCSHKPYETLKRPSQRIPRP